MKKITSLMLALVVSLALCIPVAAMPDSEIGFDYDTDKETETHIEIFNEYDYIENLQESTAQELKAQGLSVQDATAIISAFEDALFERATLTDGELKEFGYNDSEIQLLNAYADGQALSSEELRTLGSVCTGEITSYSSNSQGTATFEYSWTWDRCPIVTLSDSAAMRWVAYDANNNEIGVIQTSTVMAVDYYYMDKTTTSGTSFVYGTLGKNQPNLDFNTLNMQFSVYSSFPTSNGDFSDCYAKTGRVRVTIKAPSGSIHHIFVGGLYGHTLAGIGSPTVSASAGTIGIAFTGKTSVDSIASRKATIYCPSMSVEYW